MQTDMYEYLCLYICMSACTHIHESVHIYECMHVCIYVGMHICMYECLMYESLYTCILKSSQTFMSICMHAYM